MYTPLNSPPRVALFPDTFLEANGVATLSRQMAKFARERKFPFLLVQGSQRTEFTPDGSYGTLELKRSAAAFSLDKGLDFDPLMSRHKELVIQHLEAFKPDLVHITGPGDMGFLGLWLSHRVKVPLVASWHTNLHEYLARRLDHAFQFLPSRLRQRAANALERQGLRALLRFYRTARFTLAPNEEAVKLVRQSTGNPSFLMEHGVDLSEYSPAPAAFLDDAERPFCIGYVGRLTLEKNVRALAEIDRKLKEAGARNYRFLIVGEGGQKGWLARHVEGAEFPGVLRGRELAAAYQRIDAFVFPSRTDTFGLVLMEAMASGVPVVLAREAGARLGVEDGVSGFLSDDLAAGVRFLMNDRALRIRMGRAARMVASAHGWDRVFEHLYGTYEEGLAGMRPVLTSWPA